MDDALLSQPIVPLDESHDRRSFQCGVEPLDRYLQVQAGQDQRRRVSVCFVLNDPARSRIADYYKLAAFSVIGAALPDALRKKLPKYGQIPCTLLGRLAVDTGYRGLGLGRHLLLDALQRARALSPALPLRGRASRSPAFGHYGRDSSGGRCPRLAHPRARPGSTRCGCSARIDGATAAPPGA